MAVITPLVISTNISRVDDGLLLPSKLPNSTNTFQISNNPPEYPQTQDTPQKYISKEGKLGVSKDIPCKIGETRWVFGGMIHWPHYIAVDTPDM